MKKWLADFFGFRSDSKPHPESLSETRAMAEFGVARAQLELGCIYDMGVVVPEDLSEAIKWYRKAAEQGHAIAQRMLGEKFDRGQGVPEDQSEAARWYRKAAEQGDTSAQIVLARRCEKSESIHKSIHIVEAAKWYRKAAEQGDAYAQHSIGLKYTKGEGVPKDLALAHAWFNIACAQGHGLAQKNLADLEKQMTADQKAEAMKLAREMFEKMPKK